MHSPDGGSRKPLRVRLAADATRSPAPPRAALGIGRAEGQLSTPSRTAHPTTASSLTSPSTLRTPPTSNGGADRHPPHRLPKDLDRRANWAVSCVVGLAENPESELVELLIAQFPLCVQLGGPDKFVRPGRREFGTLVAHSWTVIGIGAGVASSLLPPPEHDGHATHRHARARLSTPPRGLLLIRAIPCRHDERPPRPAELLPTTSRGCRARCGGTCGRQRRRLPLTRARSSAKSDRDTVANFATPAFTLGLLLVSTNTGVPAFLGRPR